MKQVPGNDHRPADPDESVARLLRLAGHRPAIPEWDAALVKRAAKDEWRRKVRSRARRTLYLRAGALLAAAVVALAVGLSLWPPAPSPAATLELIAGSVEFVPAPGGEGGNTVFAGTVVETSGTATAARAALRLSGGAAVRLDAGTRLEVLSASVLALDRGAVYVDSGPAGGAGGIEVRTPLGVARDIGTQFEVRYEPMEEAGSSLRIRVREGVVDLSRGGDSERANAGVELLVRPDGSVKRGSMPGFGPGWDWVLDAAPRMEIEGRPLRDLLEWFAREQGWELRFADSESEAFATVEIMHGSPVRATEEDVFALVGSNGLRHRLEDGELVVGMP